MKPKLAVETTWIAFGQIVPVLSALVSVRLLTEHLPLSEYGHLGLALTTATLVNQIIMGALAQGAGRFFVVASEQNSLGTYFLSVRRLLIGATSAVALLTVAASFLLASLGHGSQIATLVAVSVLSLFQGYKGAADAIQNAARHRQIVAGHNVLDAILRPAFALLLIRLFGNSALNVALGFAMSAALVAGSQYFFLSRLLKRPESASIDAAHWTREIWRFSWPFSAWGLFTWGQQVSDRWSLEMFSSSENVGLFLVLFQLGYQPVSLVVSMGITLLAPILFERSGDASDEERRHGAATLTRRSALIAALATVCAFAIGALFHRSLFSLLVGTEYRSVSVYLPWVLLAGGLFAVGQILSLGPMSELRSRALLVPKVGTAMIGLFLNVFGAAYAGLAGVISAMVVFSLVYALWMLALQRRD